MRSQTFARCILFTGLIFSIGGCQSQPAAESSAPGPAQTRTPVAPSLAKAKISEATAAAKKWKPDAVLIQIAADNIGDDGMHFSWDYGFWSATAKTCYVVNVAATGGISSAQESGGEICKEPELPPNIIDSDQAIKIARSDGLKKPKASMVVVSAPTPNGDRPVWMVMDDRGMNPGDVMLDIDALSGKVLKTTTQR